jgi:uncharacterized protein YbjT (DUF2867 family)
MTKQKVLIVGASGAVGGSLLRRLLALPHPPLIRVSSRNPAQVNFPSSVEVVQGDLSDPSTYLTLFKGVDRVFLYSRHNVPVTQLMSIAKASGVTYIVLLSSIAISYEPEGMLAKMHAANEDPIAASGVPYTFLRPGPFSSNSRLFWLSYMEKTGKVLLPYPETQSTPVSDEDIAAVALVALTTHRLVNEVIDLCGPVAVSQREQVEAINRVRQRAGKKSVDLVAVSPEEWKTAMADYIPSHLKDVLLAAWEKSRGSTDLVGKTSERITGEPSQTYEEWLELNKNLFLF